MNLGSLGSVFIDVAANTGKFETDIGRAARESEKRSKEIQKGFQDAAKNIAASLAALDIGYRLGKGFRAAIDRADELDEMAQKTGATVKALSELSFAAGLEGVEDFTGALIKLNKSIIGAKDPASEQAKAFKSLGISTTDASGKLKSTDEILTEISARFADSADGANKSAIAMALFGKTGADLIPFLNNGADGLQKLRDKAKALGLSLDADTAAAAGHVNDNLYILEQSAKGLASQVAVNLLPALTDLTDGLAGVASKGDIAKGISDSLLVGFQGVALIVANVAYVLNGIGNEIGGIAAQAVALAQLDFKGAAAIHEAMLADAKERKKAIDDLNESILRLGKTAAGLKPGDAPKTDPKKPDLKFGGADSFSGTIDYKSVEADALRPLQEQVDTEGRLLEQAAKQWEDYHQAQAEGDAAMAKQRERTADATRAFTENEKLNAEKSRAIIATQADVTAGIFGNFAQAAGAMGKKAFAEFKALSIAQATASMISGAIGAFSQASLTYPPPFGQIAGAIAAAGVVASGVAQIAQIKGMSYGGGRRYGGAVSAGGMYEVAEPGNPELLRYGNKTLLMMGSQSGVVEPATRSSSAANSRAAPQQIRVVSELGHMPAVVPFVTHEGLGVRLQYAQQASVAGSQALAMQDAKFNGPVTQTSNSRTGNRRLPAFASAR